MANLLRVLTAKTLWKRGLFLLGLAPDSTQAAEFQCTLGLGGLFLRCYRVSKYSILAQCAMTNYFHWSALEVLNSSFDCIGQTQSQNMWMEANRVRQWNVCGPHTVGETMIWLETAVCGQHKLFVKHTILKVNSDFNLFEIQVLQTTFPINCTILWVSHTCEFHNHVSFTDMWVSRICQFHRHVSFRDMWVSKPCEFHRHVSFTAMSVSQTCQFHRHVSFTDMSVSQSCQFHNHVCFTDMSVLQTCQFHRHISFTDMSVSQSCQFHNHINFTDMSVS